MTNDFRFWTEEQKEQWAKSLNNRTPQKEAKIVDKINFDLPQNRKKPAISDKINPFLSNRKPL